MTNRPIWLSVANRWIHRRSRKPNWATISPTCSRKQPAIRGCLLQAIPPLGVSTESLEDVFTEEPEVEAASGDDDPFGDAWLGDDDDLPQPADFSFDPDAIPEDSVGDDSASDASFDVPASVADAVVGEPQTDQPPESTTEDLGDLGDLGDFDAADDTFASMGEDLGDLGGDLDTMDEGLVPSGDDFGDLGDVATVDEQTDSPAEQPSPDIDDDGFSDEGGFDDFGGTDVASDGEFEDSGDLDVGAFASTDDPSADFGDLDQAVGEQSDSVPTGDDFDSDDSFDIPSVDESIEHLEEEGFSLGDFGEDFELGEESLDEFAGIDQSAEGEQDEEVAADDTLDAAGEERQFSDDEFTRIQQTLGSLPLNVKIAVEECIGESKGEAQHRAQLIDALIAGKTPVAIAEVLSKALDRRIVVPKGYLKRTGQQFEQDRQSFRYRLRTVYWPLLWRTTLAAGVLAIVGTLAYRYVYRPIHAGVLYRRGYQDAIEQRYDLATDTFERATELWLRDSWFLTYARAYVDQRQYDLAVEKYDQLVYGMDADDRAFLREMTVQRMLGDGFIRTNGDAIQIIDLINVHETGILEHAALQSRILADYERAQDLYSVLLFRDEFHYEALLGQGDNYLRHAEEDPDRYEDARLAYANLLRRYGDTDEILMRFLRLFVRRDNLDRVNEIVTVFERTTPNAAIDAQIYAEAAGYLLDNGQIQDVRNMLMKSFDTSPRVPELHYQLARYNRLIEAPQQEREALDNALITYEESQPLDRRRLRQFIDTMIRSGEYWHKRAELINAGREYQRARDRYDQAKQARFLPVDSELSRVYALQADVEYYAGGNLDRALVGYQAALADGYTTDDLLYKVGFIHYDAGRLQQAADSFFEIGAENQLVGPRNVLWARANTLYRRGIYPAAEAFYQELRDRLLAERAQIQNLLVDEDPDHRALLRYIAAVNNNLGISVFRQSQESVTNADRFSESVVYLQQSAEVSENFLRQSETGVRSGAKSIAFQNLSAVLGPTGPFVPQLIVELPRDLAGGLTNYLERP